MEIFNALWSGVGQVSQLIFNAIGTIGSQAAGLLQAVSKTVGLG